MPLLLRSTQVSIEFDQALQVVKVNKGNITFLQGGFDFAGVKNERSGMEEVKNDK